MRTLGVALAALFFVAGSGQAQAGVCPVLAPVTVAVAGYSCTLGNETFSDFTITGVPSQALLEFGQFGQLSAVTLERDGVFFPMGTVVFDFKVTALAPIIMGSVGVDVSFPNVVTVTTMNGLAMMPASIKNGGTALLSFTPGVDSVMVDNTSHIIYDTSQLNSLTDDFSQTVGIPEPEPLPLLAFGLGVLVLSRWRDRE